MKHLLTTALLVSTLALGACAGGNATGDSLVDIVKAERGQTLTSPDGCVMPEDVIGKSYTELPKMKLQGPSRVVFPGATLSGDHVTNRLNFKTDKKGIIRSVSCG